MRKRESARAEHAETQEIEAFLTDITPGLADKVGTMAIGDTLFFTRADLVSDNVSLLGTASLPESFDALGTAYDYRVALERVGPDVFAVHLGLQGDILSESDRSQIKTFLRQVSHLGVGLMGSGRDTDDDVRPAGGGAGRAESNSVRDAFPADTRLIFTVNERLPRVSSEHQVSVDFTMDNAWDIDRAYWGTNNVPCVFFQKPDGSCHDSLGGEMRPGVIHPISQPHMYRLAKRLAEGWTLEPAWGEVMDVGAEEEARRMELELPVCEAGEKPVVAALAAYFFNEGDGSLEHEGFDDFPQPVEVAR